MNDKSLRDIVSLRFYVSLSLVQKERKKLRDEEKCLSSGGR